MRALIRAKQIQGLICYAIDRLSRDIAHLAILADECERHRVQLLFVTEQLDASPEGKLLQSVRGYVAEVERQKIRERTLRGKKSIAQSGKLHNGAPEKYGWRHDKEKRVRVIYEPEAETVRWIFAQGLAGKGTKRIADELNERGVLPPSAGKYTDRVARWRGYTVHQILTNAAYEGQSFAWTSSYRKGARPAEDWIKLADDTTPAIIPLEQFAQIQTRVQPNKGAAKRNERWPSLLRGLVVCGNCQCGMSSHRTNPRSPLYYRCNSRFLRDKACGAKFVRADALEAWVWEQVVALVADSSRLKQVIDEAVAVGLPAMLRADLAAAEQAAQSLRAQQERLVRSLRHIADEIAAQVIEQEIARVALELSAVHVQARTLEANLAQQNSSFVRAEGLLSYVQALQVAAITSFEERRQILNTLQFAVVVHGKH